MKFIALFGLSALVQLATAGKYQTGCGSACLDWDNDYKGTAVRNNVRGEYNIVDGYDNSVDGFYNDVAGRANRVRGQDNGVRGNLNSVWGEDNRVVGDVNTIKGIDNRIKGN